MKLAELTFEGYFWRQQLAGWAVSLVEIACLGLLALGIGWWRRRRAPPAEGLGGTFTFGRTWFKFENFRPTWAPRRRRRQR